MYCIKSGFEINEILEHGINEKKRKVFKELDNGSLNKILKYSYANTCGRCNGAGECYYCTIINYIHAEFRRRRKLPQYATCQILNCGRDTNCGCMECRKNYPPHPMIDSREQQRELSLLGSSEDDNIRYYGCRKDAFPFMVHFPNNSKSDK